MTTEQKLNLMIAIGTSRIIRKTLSNEMRLDSKRMVALIFNQDFLKRFQSNSFIMRDLLQHEWIDRQLKEAGHGGTLVLPQEKRFLLNLFPFIASPTGLIVIAIQPVENSVAVMNRTIIFMGNGHVTIM